MNYSHQTAGQSANNLQQQGYITNAPHAPKERRTESCLKRFEHLLQCYADLATQLEQVALSLAGPTPEPPTGNGAATPQPVALIGQLEYVAEQFEGRRQRIQIALTRLQEL